MKPHLPGPYFTDPKQFIEDTVYAKDAAGGDWWTICRAIDPSDDLEQRRATARFLAAAPALFEALKGMLAAHPHGPGRWAAIDAANAAIALATGTTPLVSAQAPEGSQDTKIERARSLHRVVRALHDGNCPSCGSIFPCEDVRAIRGEVCPHCGFWIADDEAAAALEEFRPVMEKNLGVFMEWRKERDAKQ